MIVIDCNLAAPVTVNAKTFDVIPLALAEMLAVPAPTALARPLALIVATEALEEFQVTELVTLCVEPSLYVPIAVS